MLRAMKSNETRLEYLGMSARRVLLIGYVISAMLGGIGGTLVAIIQQIATPEFGYWTKSGEFVFIAILGGGAHAFGAFAGAAMFEMRAVLCRRAARGRLAAHSRRRADRHHPLRAERPDRPQAALQSAEEGGH